MIFVKTFWHSAQLAFGVNIIKSDWYVFSLYLFCTLSSCSEKTKAWPIYIYTYIGLAFPRPSWFLSLIMG